MSQRLRIHQRWPRFWVGVVCLALAACGQETATDHPAAKDAQAADGTLADSQSQDGGAPGADAKSDSLAKDLPDLGLANWPDTQGNLPPTAQWLLPAEGATLTAGAPVLCKLQVGDDKTAAVDLAVAVTRIGGGKLTVAGLAISASGELSFGLKYLPAGPQQFQVSVYDGMGEGVQVSRQVTLVVDPGPAVVEPQVNTPPEAVTLVLDPPTPTVADAVACLGVAPLDADGDPLTANYAWFLDGVALAVPATASMILLADVVDGAMQAMVPAKKGQKLTCQVVLSDGQALSPPSAVTTTLLGFDACADGVDGCPAKSQCAAGDGAEALCTCNSGYALGKGVCGDVDECALSLADCATSAVCSNTDGAYSCSCPAGFEGDGKTCGDIDECAASPCPLSADCSNTAGSFACTCKAGHIGDGQDCYDIDECAAGLGGDPSAVACDLSQACSNTEGSYLCACKSGFEASGKTCKDVDECAANPPPCGLAADCSNAQGSYACSCQEGYEGDGLYCADVDECAQDPEFCSALATCSNQVGGYKCVCDPGYAGTGAECADIDECQSGAAKCSKDATCKNLAGGYDCTCKAGFGGDGKSCSDIDECKSGAAVCDANATCKNTPGDYQCLCAQGYVGDGLLCDDVDECANGSAQCHAAAICANTAGSYSCTCKAGWSGDGKVCTGK
jgi:hypothetical protein